MAYRQYTGSRYVPIFGRKNESSANWDNSAPYEPLTVVIYQGNSYISRQYVPAGIPITDANYWIETGNYNAQVEAYRQEVIQFDGRINDNAERIEDVNEIVSTINAPGWVTETRIADSAVTTGKIEDGAVTFNKIAPGVIKSYREDILKRPLGSVPYPNHTYCYNQGCCIADIGGTEYMYALHSGDNQYISQVNLESGNIATQVLPAAMAHPNDITFNPNTNRLIIASLISEGSDMYAFFEYDFTSNTILASHTPSSTRLFTIAYDAKNNRYISTRDSTPFTTFEIVFLDLEFNITSRILQTVDGEFSNQAIECYEGLIYQINSYKVGSPTNPDNDGNSIFVWDENGNFITSVYDNNFMEAEGICFSPQRNHFILAYAVSRLGTGLSSLMFFKAYISNEQVNDARLYMYNQIGSSRYEAIHCWVDFSRTNFYSDGSQARPFKKICEVTYANIDTHVWTEITCSGNGTLEADFFFACDGRWTIDTANSDSRLQWTGAIMVEKGAYIHIKNFEIVGLPWDYTGCVYVLRSTAELSNTKVNHGTASGRHNVYAYESTVITDGSFESENSEGAPIYLRNSFSGVPEGISCNKGGFFAARNGVWL